MIKSVLIFVIRAYRYVISPMFPRRCRFYPSCSEYAIQAIETYGVFRGVFMALTRIVKCNQLSPGGYDPVIKEN